MNQIKLRKLAGSSKWEIILIKDNEFRCYNTYDNIGVALRVKDNLRNTVVEHGEEVFDLVYDTSNPVSRVVLSDNSVTYVLGE